MIIRVFLRCAFLTLVGCNDQNLHTTTYIQNNSNPIVWEDPDITSILDSIVSPKLRTDTTQFRRDLVNYLSFVNSGPKKDGVSFAYASLETDTKGIVSVREVTGTPALSAQLEKCLGTMIQSLHFEPAHMVEAPDRKTPFYLDIDMYVEKDIVRFSLTGYGGVKYIETHLQRPVQ